MAKLKRIHLFELEDQKWFPAIIRDCMTRMLILLHKWMKSEKDITELLKKAIDRTGKKDIIDLCSGSGGPMFSVYNNLKKERKGISLTLTDLYPNLKLAKGLNSSDDRVSYRTTSVNAANVDKDLDGIRTMVGSMHHMKPEVARQILKDAFEAKQPLLVFELGDNKLPAILSIFALPINLISAFFISALARPYTWQQFVFTYLIPIIPIGYAWDGAVSNVRVYNLKDLDILLEGLHSDDYEWEKGVIKGGPGKTYLLGLPKS